MGWRRKAYPVAAGNWRFKADVLGALIGLPDIRKTVGRGDGGIGTLVGIVDSTGALHTYGCCTSVQAWAATGVIYGTGDYATEASRNNMTAAAGDIVTGHSVTLAGVTTDGALDMALWQLKTDSVLISAISATIIKAGEIITATTPPTHVDGAYYPVVGYIYGSDVATEVLTTATGNPGTFNATNLTVGNVIQDVAFGVGLTGTGANLLASHTTYLSLEAGRNTDPGEANVADGVTYKILNVNKEGTLVGGDYATGYADGKAVIIAALVLPATYLVDAPTMYGVNLAGYEAYYLEGTGLNQATLTAALAAAGITLPVGTYACTWTVNDGTTVLQGAKVSFWLGSVLKGTTPATGTSVTGTVAMSLDAATYTVAITLAGYTFASTTHVVSATASTWTKTFSMTSVVWPASTVTGTTTVRWRVRKTSRAYAGAADCTVYMGISQGPGVAGQIYNGDNLDYDSDATDADGYVYFANTPKGATVAVKTATNGAIQYVKIPSDCGDTFEGLELIGSG